MADEQCLPCRDICDCMTFTSPDETLIVTRTNCTISLEVNPDALTIIADPVDGTETIVDAGTGISVTGDGSSGDPYIVSNTGVLSVNGSTGNVTVAVADGSETIVNAGTGITVSGAGTIGSPYVITCTVAATTYDGSETKINAGTGISKSGTGTIVDPYIITNTGVLSVNGNTGVVVVPTYDGSETIVQAGTNVTVTGTGTVADPYIVNALTGSSSLLACDVTWSSGFSQVAGGNYVGAWFVYKPGNYAKWRGNMQYIASGGVSTTYTLFATTVPAGLSTCPASGPHGVAYPTGQTYREFFVHGTNAADDVFTFKVYADTVGRYYIRALGAAPYAVGTYIINLEPIHFEIS